MLQKGWEDLFQPLRSSLSKMLQETRKPKAYLDTYMQFDPYQCSLPSVCKSELLEFKEETWSVYQREPRRVPLRGQSLGSDPGKELGFHRNPRQETFQMRHRFWRHCCVKQSIVSETLHCCENANPMKAFYRCLKTCSVICNHKVRAYFSYKGQLKMQSNTTTLCI